ncbi:MAG: DUF4912 domain-containing protein [Treponema sp.]|nr:DUF4912 domain-containing protein [Treponema sp.]
MPYLESLSTAELVELAGRNGLDIPPSLERVFIIGELLELERANAKWDNRQQAENGESPDDLPESDLVELREIAELPEQYGFSYIDVLIRDPLWVFAFWEIKRSARDFQDEGASSVEHCLRIVPLRGGADDLRADIAASFTVAVGASDHSLYLGIPREDGRCFKIELCVRQGEGCTVIAASHPFRLPRLVSPPSDLFLDPDVRKVCDNPLSVLSGAKCFPLVRSIDRLHRHKVR